MKLYNPTPLLFAVMLTSGVLAAEPTVDPWRPRLHFTAPDDWINDPNGLFRVGTEWHLQFQYKWPRHWGHAKSADLLHWEMLPVALAPDAVGDIWSGCTVRDDHNTSGFFAPGKGGLVSAYASYKKPAQHISLAFSADEGATWQRPPGNPVLDPGKTDFRDPKVFWHAPTTRWAMVVAADKQLEFYSSPDLKKWTRTGEFGVPPRPSQVFECPDLFKLPVEGGAGREKWVLVSSFIDNGACETRYWIGEFDGNHFQTDTTEAKLLGSGPDDYAAITWPRDPATGRTVLIGWMNTWTYADNAPTKPWKGCMTLPRELTLHATAGGGWSLRQRPIRELWVAPPTSQTLTASDGRSILGKMSTGALKVKLRPQRNAVVAIELFSAGSNNTEVGYDAARGVVYFDRRESGGTAVSDKFPLRREAPLALDAEGVLDMEIVWDRSTLEVFAGDGAVYLSGLVFPDPAADEVAIRVSPGSTPVDVQLWQFK